MICVIDVLFPILIALPYNEAGLAVGIVLILIVLAIIVAVVIIVLYRYR